MKELYDFVIRYAAKDGKFLDAMNAEDVNMLQCAKDDIERMAKLEDIAEDAKAIDVTVRKGFRSVRAARGVKVYDEINHDGIKYARITDGELNDIEPDVIASSLNDIVVLQEKSRRLKARCVMPDIATPQYARALLAEQERKMKETIAEVMRAERDPITAHKLAEVAAECEWCERVYGEVES